MARTPNHLDFDLERALSGWRWRLRLAKTLLAEDLDELEAHLRDQIDAFMEDGLDARDAYYRALNRMGTNDVIESEYRKIRFTGKKKTPNAIRFTLMNTHMLKNYLKTALRSFLRHPGFAAINLGGLAVGLSACLLIGLFVKEELSFDEFHEHGQQIYRLGGASVGWPYGRILAEEYPEVERVVYMRSYPTYPIRHRGTYYHVPLRYADEGFFRMFSFPLVKGDPDDALVLPYSMVLSEPFAETLFGSEEPLGQTVMVNDTLRFTVTGVAQVPARSHIQFNALVSFETLRAMNPDWYEAEMAGGWLDLNVVNYVQLRDSADPDLFAAKIRDLPEERAAEYLARWGSEYKLALEPLGDIYLRSPYGNQLGPAASMATVTLLATIGLFLLLIAVVNFVNLTTARSLDRAREVGVRKAMGGTRSELMRQFLGESILTCFLAMLLACALAWLALPFFNNLANRSYELSQLASLSIGGAVALVTVGVGALAGLYPAAVLSSFRPIAVLGGRVGTGRSGSRLRQALVVVQFVVSGVLIIGTLVILGQLRFMQTQKLGFDADQVLVLDAGRVPASELARGGDAFRQELLSLPAISSVTQTSYVPGRSAWRGQLSFPEGMPDGQSVSLEYVPVDYDYIETLGMEIVAGRDFDESFTSDAESAVIINRQAVAAAGWETPAEAVGKRYASPGSRKPEGVVIGVVQDYHHHGLQTPIGPMMFGIRKGGSLFAMRLAGADAADALPRVQQTWRRVFGDSAPDYFFLDQDFARQYDEERRLSRIFVSFTILAILIATLGLFGLAAHTTSKRTKEIGIRKVLGASPWSIAAHLSRGFLATVLIAFVVSIPIAYLALSRWLEQFAYRIGVEPSVILLSGVLLIVLSVVTVSWQALSAASADPVDTLRYE